MLLGTISFNRSEKGKYCSKNKDNVIKAFIPTSGGIDDAIMSRNECEDYCQNDETCWGCSVHCGNPCQWNAIPECGNYNDWGGVIEGDITRKITSDGNFYRMSVLIYD